MNSGPPQILVVNGGSSSIRFGVYGVGEAPRPVLVGKIERIGLSGTNLTAKGPALRSEATSRLASGNYRAAIVFLLDWLQAQPVFPSIKAVGHRVVHGMRFSEPERITPTLLAKLCHIASFAPNHLPHEIELMEAFRKRHPKLPQVACFDTAFHRTLPRVARLLPLPRRYAKKGVERYGFHGLSYAYLLEELVRLGDPAATKGRVILAHLGNGASLAAVRDGQSIDTSMGFTPTAGLMMSTRSGDLDPGLLSFLARNERMTMARLGRMVNNESGLLGVSETSSDMRDLLAREARDVRAAEAVELFCYHAKKWIGSFAAALGGVDTLVFSGGIGENAPSVRARICDGMSFLGIEIDPKRNGRSAPQISPDSGVVKVRVIRTDEELMIARAVTRILKLGPYRKSRP